MIRKPDLETRVRSILDPSRRRTAAGLLLRCAIALAALALIFPIALTRQSVHAQGKVYKMTKDMTGAARSSKRKRGASIHRGRQEGEKIEGAVVIQRGNHDRRLRPKHPRDPLPRSRPRR